MCKLYINWNLLKLRLKLLVSGLNMCFNKGNYRLSYNWLQSSISKYMSTMPLRLHSNRIRKMRKKKSGLSEKFKYNPLPIN
jgi:hypothetical protein